MRSALIRRYVHQLVLDLGGVRKPVNEKLLREAFDRQDLKTLTRLVRDSLGLRMPIRLGIVKPESRSVDGAAWVAIPDNLPMYGTAEFDKTLITIHVRKAPQNHHIPYRFETVVAALAHEMTHIVLHGTRHVMCDDELATDLAAMVLGYRKFYLAYKDDACEEPETTLLQDIEEAIGHFFKGLAGEPTGVKVWRVGYLEPDEIELAAGLLETLAHDAPTPSF